MSCRYCCASQVAVSAGACGLVARLVNLGAGVGGVEGERDSPLMLATRSKAVSVELLWLLLVRSDGWIQNDTFRFI